MADGSINYRSQDGVAIITIDRPNKRNAMTSAMCEQLRDALLALESGDDRAGILCAVGDVFCAGADLSGPPEQFWRALPGIGVALSKPLIAAVQGPVVGLAVTIVTFCDLCVACETTKFIYPEAQVGISKGLIASIVARIPHKIAMELMLLGRSITAQRGYDVGFVNCVTPAGEQLTVARELAGQLARSAPLVLGQLKALAAQTLPSSPVESLYRATQLVERVTLSEDAQEGLRAFREKRSPKFEGK